MKRKQKYIILICIVILIAFLKCTENKQDIIAEVGSYKITLNEFSDRYKDYLIMSGLEDNISLRAAVIRNLVNEKLLYYYDDNEDLFNNEEYKKELDWVEKQALLAYLKDQEIYAKIDVTEEELRQTFVRVNEKIEARHLYAQTFEEAEKLYNLILSGVSFEDLAKSVFTDSTLRNNGGYIGFFTWGDMDPAFEDKAYAMKIGEVSKPVKTALGYSVIKVENRVKHPLLTESEFAKKRRRLENTLKIKKKIPYETKYVNQVFDKDKFSINQELIESVFYNFYGSSKLKLEQHSLNLDEVCVNYNTTKYTVKDIIEKIKKVPNYHLNNVDTPQKLKITIENLIKQDLLIDEAIKKGYDNNENVMKKTDQQKLNTYLKYKRKELLYKAHVPDSLVSSYYDQHKDLFYSAKKMNVQEIIVGNVEKANRLLARLKDGEDFGALSKEHSLRKYSAENGGYLGLSEISNYGNLKDIFWDSKINEIIGPLNVADYYGIFRVTEKVDKQQLELKDVYAEALEGARLLNQDQIFNDYFNELTKKVKVTINKDLLKTYKI